MVKILTSRSNRGLKNIHGSLLGEYYVVPFNWVPTARTDRRVTADDVAEREQCVTETVNKDDIDRKSVRVNLLSSRQSIQCTEEDNLQPGEYI